MNLFVNNKHSYCYSTQSRNCIIIKNLTRRKILFQQISHIVVIDYVHFRIRHRLSEVHPLSNNHDDNVWILLNTFFRWCVTSNRNVMTEFWSYLIYNVYSGVASQNSSQKFHYFQKFQIKFHFFGLFHQAVATIPKRVYPLAYSYFVFTNITTWSLGLCQTIILFISSNRPWSLMHMFKVWSFGRSVNWKFYRITTQLKIATIYHSPHSFFWL